MTWLSLSDSLVRWLAVLSVVPSVSLLQPLDQRVLRGLCQSGIRVIDDEHHDPLFAAMCFYIAGDGFHAFQRAGLEVRIPRDLVILETFFHRAVHAQYRQRGFQLGRERAARGALQQLGKMKRTDTLLA